MNEEFERYRETIQFSKDLIFWVDIIGDVRYCNNSFIKFFKFENINIKIFDKKFKTKNSWENMFRALSHEPLMYETIYKNYENITIPVEFYISKIKNNSLALIVAKDITERKKFDFKIKQFAEEIIKRNKDLQDFAYIASHDLKEPLRKISMFSNDLLSRKDGFKNKLDIDCLNKISEASFRMQDMIDSILDYSRVGTSGKEFKKESLLEIVNNAIDNCEVSINSKKVTINLYNIKEKTVLGDFKQLVQVFQNIISNSIKFSKKDTSPIIDIGIEKEHMNKLFIYVKDNGIGMKEEFNEKIFTPFTKLHSKSKYEGHGMGLSICKRIIERHGGTIKSDSVENEWFKITFDLQSEELKNEEV